MIYWGSVFIKICLLLGALIKAYLCFVPNFRYLNCVILKYFMRMKQNLPNARQRVAIWLFVMAFAMAIINFFMWGRCILLNLPFELFYETALWCWVSNFVIGGIFFVAFFLCNLPSLKKVNCLGLVAWGGILSFFLFGFTSIYLGVILGKVLWMSLLFVITVYALCVIFFGTRYWCGLILGFEAEYDDDYYLPNNGELTTM